MKNLLKVKANNLNYIVNACKHINSIFNVKSKKQQVTRFKMIILGKIESLLLKEQAKIFSNKTQLLN